MAAAGFDPTLPPAPDRPAVDVLTVGFATTVAMWAAGYLCRLPGIEAPPTVLFALLVLCLVGGGLAAGRYLRGGWKAGALTGLITAVLNLMVLGGLVQDPHIAAPSVLLWLPGCALASAALGALTAALAARRPVPLAPGQGVHRFAVVALAATLLLLITGGLVTSKRAGLSVPDWPNSFGSFMFLYPLSRMTGGVYYEHAHRLYGSLVGLTTIALGVLLWTHKTPRLRGLAVALVVMVILQGIMGGYRVALANLLEGVPVSTPEHESVWSISLAVAHGAFGQVFFAALVGAAVVTSASWRRLGGPLDRPAAPADRTLTALLVGVVLFQLLLGALQRHVFPATLGPVAALHISVGVMAALLAFSVALRFWGESADPVLDRWGKVVLTLFGVQLLLGIGAAVGVAVAGQVRPPPTWKVLLTTPHQITGAILLAASVTLMLYAWRAARTTPAASADTVPAPAGAAGR